MHQNIWFPFTILKDALEPLRVQSGEGLWLELDDGRRIMDSISSWWVNTYGHAQPKIAEAISEQAQKLEHVIFANFTHNPAEQVAEKLAKLLPGQLNRVFYSDDGSTAMEVAMKIAFQYWRNRGDDRKTFICFEGAYHGDTFGAMSVGSRSVFTEVFKELLFDVAFIPFPHTWQGDEKVQKKEQMAIQKLDELLSENPDEYAAVLIEPLVQGCSGMRICRKEFLQKLERVCCRHNILLVFDEVMTGFGRTGARFACERAGVEPDIISLAKGLTGGFLPLAATVCSDKIYEAFITDDPLQTFWHGHSYTANPLGCAAALASFELLEEYQPVFSSMEKWHIEYLRDFKDHPRLKHLRVLGTIVAMDIKTGEGDMEVDPYTSEVLSNERGYLDSIADDIKKHCIDHGILLRPLGNVLYLMPPYCTTRKQLGMMYEKIGRILEEVG
jgi:adenosylmethionine-8-amino-7-oxononanoate aminotransferase